VDDPHPVVATLAHEWLLAEPVAVIALILSAVGVLDQAIAADYAASAIRLDAHYRAKRARIDGPELLELVNELHSARPDTMLFFGEDWLGIRPHLASGHDQPSTDGEGWWPRRCRSRFWRGPIRPSCRPSPLRWRAERGHEELRADRCGALARPRSTSASMRGW
jgi:hypothetical protein